MAATRWATAPAARASGADPSAHSSLLNLPDGIFDNWNIHIHVPEGAIPKDGPSAGITMVTSLASALTQRKVKANLAMTGEITLRGKVLPVGGIREKILAAKRAGITDIILCMENKKDIDEIQPMYVKGLNFHYVKDIKEVLKLALTDELVSDPINFGLTNNSNTEKKANEMAKQGKDIFMDRGVLEILSVAYSFENINGWKAIYSNARKLYEENTKLQC